MEYDCKWQQSCVSFMGLLMGSKCASVNDCMKANSGNPQDHRCQMSLPGSTSKDPLDQRGSKETCQSKQQGNPTTQGEALRYEIKENKSADGDEDESIQKGQQDISPLSHPINERSQQKSYQTDGKESYRVNHVLNKATCFESNQSNDIIAF
jgi:hypothetical protein